MQRGAVHGLRRLRPWPFQQGAAEGKWTEVLKELPLLSLKPSSTFGQLLETMATQGLHRLYITDDEGKPVSIVTLTDVLREIVKPEPPAHRFQRLPDVLPEDSEEEEEETKEAGEAATATYGAWIRLCAVPIATTRWS